MSHNIQFSPSPFEQLSLEEQIEYVETHLDEIVADLMAAESIPYWHRELLADHFRRFRSQTEGGMTWDEFEKELDKELAQD
jgi:hypothetical protein